MSNVPPGGRCAGIRADPRVDPCCLVVQHDVGPHEKPRRAQQRACYHLIQGFRPLNLVRATT